MKYLATIMAALCLAGFQPANRADFSGSWRLDLKKSSNLPASFQSVDSYTMKVQQTADSLIVNVHLKGNGQEVDFPPTYYTFDSVEVFREDTLRGSKRWMRGMWTTTGMKLIIESRVEQKRGDLKYAERDIWQMNGQNTLQVSVRQEYAGKDSSRSERRVFQRVK